MFTVNKCTDLREFYTQLEKATNEITSSNSEELTKKINHFIKNNSSFLESAQTSEALNILKQKITKLIEINPSENLRAVAVALNFLFISTLSLGDMKESILHEIFSHLDPQDLGQTTLTSRLLNTATKSYREFTVFENKLPIDMLPECKTLKEALDYARENKLYSLNLSEFKITNEDLKEIASLPHLTELSIESDLLTDLSPLENLPLTDLSISSSTLRDLSPLAKVTSLKSLALSGCPLINDLSPVAALRKLGMLEVHDCPLINDISPLAALKELKEFYLISCAGINKQQINRLKQELPKCRIDQLGL